jgi:hypothetical protein
MVKIRYAIVALVALIAFVVVGCGGSGSADSGSTPASVATPGSLVYVEGDLQPTGELKENVDSVTETIVGIGNLGDYIVTEIEGAASAGGQSVDFAKEVQPWLGERAGVAFHHLEDEELSEPLIAIETTDAETTQALIDKQAQGRDVTFEDASYEGVEFKVGGSEDNAIGVIGDFLVIADSEAEFKKAVDASDGDSLADEARFEDAISAASEDSLADVYVDVGGLMEQSEDRIDPSTREALESSGIDPSEATAVASVIPGTEQITVDLSSDLGGEEPPRGDASQLLGSMPASALGAFAASGFGDQVQEAIDSIDEGGVPPELPPGKLKSTLSEAGVDIDSIVSSLEDAAVFVQGTREGNLGGALVVTSESSEAGDALITFGDLLRAAKVPGVTAVTGKAKGFSLRSEELGSKPLVVVAKDTRISIGYGLASALQGIAAGSSASLSATPLYKEAVAALGETPISAFVEGPAAVRLAEDLVPRSSEDFWDARTYLKKITFIGMGQTEGDDVATATLIAGLQK